MNKQGWFFDSRKTASFFIFCFLSWFNIISFIFVFMVIYVLSAILFVFSRQQR